MRNRTTLLLLLPLAAGACSQVLGLDEPTIRDGAGGAPTTGAQTSSTGATVTSTTGGGDATGNTGAGGGAAGGGGAGGCEQHVDCDDQNPCTIDVCSDGACVNEASGTDPVDDGDDCVDVTCAGEVPTFTPDDTEDAADPNPPCHTAVCNNGVPSDVFAPADTVCGEAPLVCDGQGSCAGCTFDADCGPPTPCADPQCGDDGVCDPGLLPVGTAVEDEEGNCRAATCSGVSAVPNPQYAPDDLPPPMTCAEVSCVPSGPRIEPANDGEPCTVLDFEGVCSGNGVGDDACVQCQEQNDCSDEAGGDRCFLASGICGCAGQGDCEGYWRHGRVCTFDGGLNESVCGCQIAGDCLGNMHGTACVAARCGCVDAGDCTSARLGTVCLDGLDRCGCEDDTDCTGSPRGLACLADAGCGCDSSADCPGTPCNLQLHICGV